MCTKTEETRERLQVSGQAGSRNETEKAAGMTGCASSSCPASWATFQPGSLEPSLQLLSMALLLPLRGSSQPREWMGNVEATWSRCFMDLEEWVLITYLPEGQDLVTQVVCASWYFNDDERVRIKLAQYTQNGFYILLQDSSSIQRPSQQNTDISPSSLLGKNLSKESWATLNTGSSEEPAGLWEGFGPLRVFLFGRFLKFYQITFPVCIWLFQGVWRFHPFFHCSPKWAKAQLSFLYFYLVRVKYLCSLCCTQESLWSCLTEHWYLFMPLPASRKSHSFWGMAWQGNTPIGHDCYRGWLNPVLLRSLLCLQYHVRGGSCVGELCSVLGASAAANQGQTWRPQHTEHLPPWHSQFC